MCLRTPKRQLSVEHRNGAAVREFSLNESMARKLPYRLFGLMRLIIQCTGRLLSPSVVGKDMWTLLSLQNRSHW